MIVHKRKRRIAVLLSGSGRTRSRPKIKKLPLTDGLGSNLQALLEACDTPRLPSVDITFVLSSRSNAYGLIRAFNHSPPIPTSICALKTFLNQNPGSTREHYDAEIARRVIDSRPDLVVLAGWMHILSDAFLDILNGVTQPPSAPALPPPDPASLPTQTEPIPSHTPANSTSFNHLPEPLHTQSFPIPCINLHPALPGSFDGANAIGRAHEAFGRGEIQKTGVMVHRVVRDVDQGEPLVVRELEMRRGESLHDLEERLHEVGQMSAINKHCIMLIFVIAGGARDHRGGSTARPRGARPRRADIKRCMSI